MSVQNENLAHPFFGIRIVWNIAFVWKKPVHKIAVSFSGKNKSFLIRLPYFLGQAQTKLNRPPAFVGTFTHLKLSLQMESSPEEESFHFPEKGNFTKEPGPGRARGKAEHQLLFS